LWAVAAILFRRVGDHVSAMGINLGKGMVALICLGILLLFAGDFSTIGDESLTALALSGLIGICFGDTLYFLTLVRLGPRRTLLLGAMIPVTTALIAVAFLHERVTGMAWLGVLCTIAGVTYVLWQRAPEGGNQQVRQAGLFYGILFVLANALGIIAAKVGVSDVPAMEATFIRQIFAIAGLTFWGLMVRDLLGWVAPLKDRRVLKVLVMAAVIGAFLGTWLSIVALKYTHAAVAASLNSTSPLFILPLAAFLLKERVSVREVVGAVVAVVGVGLYFSSLGLA
jgi:drug/metabolite transporter (DMT)-like permease